MRRHNIPSCYCLEERAEGCETAIFRDDLESEQMFARRIKVEYEVKGSRHPCPLKWLDNFSMRSFTNATKFDDTLPISDGLMEIGSKVPLDELKNAMEDWFRRKSYLAKDASLMVEAMGASSADSQ